MPDTRKTFPGAQSTEFTVLDSLNLEIRLRTLPTDDSSLKPITEVVSESSMT